MATKKRAKKLSRTTLREPLPPKRSPNGRPVGRPLVTATKTQLAQIETAAGYGLTDRMIARLVLQCTERTWERMKKRDPRLDAAMESGQAKVGFQVSNALVNRAKAGDVPAIRWFEMTRQNRRERTDVNAAVEVTERKVIFKMRPTAPPGVAMGDAPDEPEPTEGE